MSWVRFDDNYREHPKIVFAGKSGRELHTAMVFYCARELTDGRIHVNQVAKLAGAEGIDDWQEALARLKFVVPGFEHPLIYEREFGYLELHDYHVYQPTKAKVIADRTGLSEKRAEAGRLGGIASGETRREQAGSKNEAKGEANRQQNGSPVPVSDSDSDSEAVTDPDSHRGAVAPVPAASPPLESATRTAFKKPSLEEMTEYFRNKGHPDLASRCFDHYEANGWRVGRVSMKDWQAACRTWIAQRNEFSNGNGSKPTRSGGATNHDDDPYAAVRIRKQLAAEKLAQDAAKVVESSG